MDPETLIPKALTSCADAPAVPARPAQDQPRTDDAKAGYIADLKGAYDDCKGTVNAIAVRRSELDAQAAGKPSPSAAPKPGFHISIPFIHPAKK